MSEHYYSLLFTEGVPFSNINAYNIHDVSEWRDLNLKFILQVMRDYRLLRGHTAPFGNRRYRSIAYIDDVRDGTEDDLYVRATGQADDPEGLPVATPVTPISPSPPARPPGAAADILDLLYRSADGEPEPRGERTLPAEAPAAAWDAERYLADLYPACVALLRRAALWDRDGDGLIENGGFPDQTYDAWVMMGPRLVSWLCLHNAINTFWEI